MVVGEVGILEPLSLESWTTTLSINGGTLHPLHYSYATFMTQRRMQPVALMNGVERQAVETTLRLPLRY